MFGRNGTIKVTSSSTHNHDNGSKMNGRQPQIAVLTGMHPHMLVCFGCSLENQQLFE